MFGYQIGFNIDDDDEHRTGCGCCCSMIIFLNSILFLIIYTFNSVTVGLDRPLTVWTEENYLNKVPISHKDGFRFAIGLSALK